MAKTAGTFPTSINPRGGLYWNTVGSALRDPRPEFRLSERSAAKGDIGWDDLPAPRALTGAGPFKGSVTK